jgi:glucose/arabinose dehydrogenase
LNNNLERGELVFVDKSNNSTTDTNITTSTDLNLKTEIISEDLDTPWSMTFTNDNRLLVTERTGSVVEILLDQGNQKRKIKEFPQIQGSGEEGLMSIVIDPEYNTNKWIYVAAAFPVGNEFEIKVLRYVDSGQSLEDETIIIDKIPGARNHAGTGLGFGPDGKLYISTGDALNREDAQNLESLSDKIIRISS